VNEEVAAVSRWTGSPSFEDSAATGAGLTFSFVIAEPFEGVVVGVAAVDPAGVPPIGTILI
jgi:hypothetical protein